MAQQHTYSLTRWLFLRLLGLVYLIAFISSCREALGLYGSSGILPLTDFLNAARQQLGEISFLQLPTLFKWGATDDAIISIHLVGIASALLLVAGYFELLVLPVLWLSYLSLCIAGQEFYWFQWDALLLETGFLAIFYAPATLVSKISERSEPAHIVHNLLLFLLFKLMLLSGVVKLASGDKLWWNLTALSYHYETQPLPTVLGWYAHQLPESFQQLSVFLMFVIELLVPFSVFLPAKLRAFGFFPLVGLQLLIALTGNYCFFNLVTAVLCVLLLSDQFLQKLFPLTANLAGTPKARNPRGPRRSFYLHLILAALVVGLSSLEAGQRLGFVRFAALPKFVQAAWQAADRYRSVNAYGLFANMTSERFEIIVEGSHDHENWQAYEFRWKPGSLERPPGWVAPFQPRLDWQLWFAALGSCDQNQWFVQFLIRLLQDSQSVTNLLAHNPFISKPPRFIRSTIYRYHFTSWSEHKATGNWWKRSTPARYCPILSLKR